MARIRLTRRQQVALYYARKRSQRDIYSTDVATFAIATGWDIEEVLGDGQDNVLGYQ